MRQSQCVFTDQRLEWRVYEIDSPFMANRTKEIQQIRESGNKKNLTNWGWSKICLCERIWDDINTVLLLRSVFSSPELWLYWFFKRQLFVQAPHACFFLCEGASSWAKHLVLATPIADDHQDIITPKSNGTAADLFGHCFSPHVYKISLFTQRNCKRSHKSADHKVTVNNAREQKSTERKVKQLPFP